MSSKELQKIFSSIDDRSNYEVRINGKSTNMKGKRLKIFILSDKKAVFKELKQDKVQPSNILSPEKLTNNE